MFSSCFNARFSDFLLTHLFILSKKVDEICLLLFTFGTKVHSFISLTIFEVTVFSNILRRF